MSNLDMNPVRALAIVSMVASTLMFIPSAKAEPEDDDDSGDGFRVA